MAKRRSKRKIVYIAAAVLLVVAAMVILEATNTTNFFGKSEIIDTTSKSTSDAPTAQEDFTDGGDRTPAETKPDDEGTVTDRGGNATATPSSQWSSSSSGELIVYTPTANSILKNGSTLSGKASTSTVSFRLIDNVSGVIAQGELSVVNGTYSGTFQFDTSASEGRLDVFNTRYGGVEYNNVAIPVKFK